MVLFHDLTLKLSLSLQDPNEGGEQNQEVDYDKIMAEQAAKLMGGKAKGGPMQKKRPLISRDKYL